MADYIGRDRALDGLLSHVNTSQWYLEEGILSVVEDSFGYLGIERGQLDTLRKFVSDALSKLEFGFYLSEVTWQEDGYYIHQGLTLDEQEIVIGIVRDVFEMIAEHLIGDSMLRLGMGKPNMKRWHNKLLRQIPDFFEIRSKRENPDKHIRHVSDLQAYRFALAIEKKVADISIPIVQPEDLRKRHTYIIGLSGLGKTTLLWNMALHDLKNGDGFGFIAPDNDIFEEKILPHVPDDRMNDVIYVNPGDPLCNISLNPFHLGPDDSLDLKADEVFTVFNRVLGAGTTPRLKQILKQSIYALLELPDGTLKDMRRLLDRDDPSFRYHVLGQIKRKTTIQFFSEDYPNYPKTAHEPLSYQLGDFTGVDLVANTLCRIGNVLDFRKAMDSGKIVLCNLTDGKLGPGNAAIFGSLIIAYCQLAAMSREDIPERTRKVWYLYVDEFQKYTGLQNVSFDEILSRARKYAMPLVLAHQNAHQIGDLIKQVFGTASSIISFGTSADDAAVLTRQGLADKPSTFTGLKKGETLCKLGTSAFSMKAPFPPRGGLPWRAEKIIRESQRKDGGRKVRRNSKPDSSAQQEKPKEKPASPHVEVDPDELL